MNGSTIFPELVTGRLDAEEFIAWTVKEGSTSRGGASCDLSRRILEVPLDSSEVARVVRAHELLHARVSPRVEHFAVALEEVTSRALECAEELRVNTLAARIGFDVALLADGSEREGGRHVAERGDWGEALCFMVAVLGTGGEGPFLRAVRKARPEWRLGLGAVAQHVRRSISRTSTAYLSDTAIVDGLPLGFARTTLVVARLLTKAIGAAPPLDAPSLRVFRRSLEPGGRRAPSGRFATLQLDEDAALRATARRGPTRRWRPATSGTTLRYPERLLIDDQHRLYARSRPTKGGVVVIDQSGSMDLTLEDLQDLLRVAPGALVVGYSHRPGDVTGSANAWLLARHGLVHPSPPSGQVGNGVDGPVVRWAVQAARPGETVVWVTDGQVTDSNDHPCSALTKECAELVRRHRVRLARDVREARQLLRQHGSIGGTRWDQFGRLGREITLNQVY
ncbi:MAG: hypothetical protein KGJ42_04735 [Acidobacteriota bacterium]|nr:hypothetical protein [Acidobacteriota bacterium]